MKELKYFKCGINLVNAYVLPTIVFLTLWQWVSQNQSPNFTEKEALNNLQLCGLILTILLNY